MAITIVSNITDGSFLPVSNPINITVNSNNTGKCNFRYVCDVLIDDVNVFRFKLFPDPNTGYGFFQLADVISDYLKQNVVTTNAASALGASTSTDKTVAKVLLRFGEEYDNTTNCSGQVQVFPFLQNSNTFWAFYGALDYEEWPTYNFLDYVVNNTNKPTKFLTKIPRGSVECSFGDDYYLDFLINSQINTTTTRVRILAYQAVGQPTVLDITPNATAQRRIRIACGPRQINKLANAAFINASTIYYTVQVVNTSTGELTESFRINVSKPKLRRKRIGFIGSLGSMEYITFFHRDRAAFQIDRKNYKSYLTSRKGNAWSYAVGDRQGSTYAVTAKENHVVTTFVNRNISKWLYELWLSTEVYIDDRPRQFDFRVFREDLTPTSRMLFYLPEDHGLKVGDSFFVYSEDNSDFNDRFTVTSVEGRIVDCGLTYNIYNLADSACGWLVIDEVGRKIPILPNDEEIEVKQKLDRPIEYTLTYSMSVDKITLRS